MFAASKLLMKKILFLALMLCASFGLAQGVNPALQPPKGAQLAIVVFEDLECPVCRVTAPVVRDAGKTYKIPVLRHDFPLPNHTWSFQAAVMAHHFDSKSKVVGNAFRDYIFEHQLEITPENLRSYADKFAAEHKADLPFVVDPQGKLTAEVNAERDLGNRIGIKHTPTVYVVSSKSKSRPFIEVTDPRGQLFLTIDAMKRE